MTMFLRSCNKKSVNLPTSAAVAVLIFVSSRCACAANHYVIAVKCLSTVQISTSSATVGLTSEKVVLYNMAAGQGAISKQLFNTL